MTGSLQLKNNRYYVVLNIYDEFGKRHRKWIKTELTTKSKVKEREQKLREILSQYESNPQILNSKVLFSDYVKVWLKEAKIKVDKVTYQHYENDAKNHIIPYFDNIGIKLADVDRQFYKTILLKNTKTAEKTAKAVFRLKH